MTILPRLTPEAHLTALIATVPSQIIQLLARRDADFMTPRKISTVIYNATGASLFIGRLHSDSEFSVVFCDYPFRVTVTAEGVKVACESRQA